MAGYSKTPLAKKLGITKPGQTVALIQQPDGFDLALGPLPSGVECHDRLAAGTVYDIIVCFTDSQCEFARRLPLLRAALQPNGGIWIAWPKKASKVPTDMSEDAIRHLALRSKLVDNKVCAIDDIWSGLRLVIPIIHRSKKAEGR